MPTPRQKRIIVLQSSNHASEFHSLRDAVADSQNESNESTESGGDDLTGEDYSEASPYDTIPTGNGNDGFRSTLGIINTGNGGDFLTEFSGVSSVEATIHLPAIQKVREATHHRLSEFFTGGIRVAAGDVNGDGFVDLSIGAPYADPNGLIDAGGDFLIGGYSELRQEAVSEFSGVSPVEATLLLPAVQKIREAAHSSGASSSDGAWALGSTFELTSGVPFSSQTETSGRTFIPPSGGPPILWPPR